MLDTWTAAEDEKEDCQDDEDDESDNSSPEQATSPAGLPPTSGKSTDQVISDHVGTKVKSKSEL